LRPLLRWIARSRTPEIFTAAALLLVVGTAAFMQAVGLSMALGAFLAGVLLAESEFRRELETDLEPFKGLLLGLFFMAVGMTIDLGVLAASPGRVALVLGLFLLVKLVVIGALARLMRLPQPERPLFTLLLAQGGEFAFVVFQAAVGARVFPAKTASLLTGAVALSMLLGPLLLWLVDRYLQPRLDPAPRPDPRAAEHTAGGAGHRGRVRTLRPDRLAVADGLRPVRHGAGPRRRTDRADPALRLSGVLRRRHPAGSAAHRRRRAGAHVLVVAVDDSAQSLAIVDLARAHFPALKIVARARDVTHWYALRDRGVEHIQRELFESSLASAGDVLQLLGRDAATATQATQRFRSHNLALLEETYPLHKDEARLIAAVRQGRQQLQEQLARERESREPDRAGAEPAATPPAPKF
jgi:glutathione-regulated potassium-efflux system ancillary protein KefC